jgi:hypothetical protein
MVFLLVSCLWIRYLENRGCLLKRWPLLRLHRLDDALDVLDVRPFMASQPIRVVQRSPLEYLSWDHPYFLIQARGLIPRHVGLSSAIIFMI